MNIIPEEFNIILAALKKSQLAFEGLAAGARADGDHMLARNHGNSAMVCLGMIAIMESHRIGSEALPLREQQFFFIVRVLRTTAIYTREAAEDFRRRGNIQQAAMDDAFAAGCDVVAEKWMRGGFRERMSLIH